MVSKSLAELNPISDQTKNTLSRAIIHSLEGGIYLLEIECHGVSEYVVSSDGKRPKTFNALHQAKEFAKKLNIHAIELSLDTPYDQMIGLNSFSQYKKNQ